MQDNQKGSKTPVHLSGCLRLREDIKNKCVSDHKEENNVSYFLKIFYLLIYLFLAALGPHCCMQTFSSCGVPASLCGGFSCCRAQTLAMLALAVVVCGLSCPMACVILVPGSGIEPALAGGFLTTGAPGKSQCKLF